jgi:hypothetical protein
MNKLIRFFRIVLTGMVMAAVFSSCAVRMIPEQSQVPRKILVATDGLIIKAADNSFQLESGKVYDTPFAAQSHNINLHLAQKNVTPYYLEAMENFNAAPVIIQYPGREDPIYGVLLISYLFPGVLGPAAASYQLEIRPEDVNALTGGNIVAVFENYQTSESYSYEDQKLVPKSWILWMSNVPLW